MKISKPKINKLKIYVDYTQNPIEVAVTKPTTILGQDVYIYNAVFSAFGDKKQIQARGRLVVLSNVRKDIENKVLTGSSTGNLSYRAKNGDTYDIIKSGSVIQSYIDNPDKIKIPLDQFITNTQFENLSIENIFVNGNKIDIVWSEIKYSQSKKAYTIRWEERDKR